MNEKPNASTYKQVLENMKRIEEVMWLTNFVLEDIPDVEYYLDDALITDDFASALRSVDIQTGESDGVDINTLRLEDV